MKKQLESTIGQLGHVGYVIPWVYHFLSRLRSLLSCSGKHRQINIDDKCIRDLDLMQEVLDKTKTGLI
jgi:succinate dehydrogenase/fumarate reductase cytochrome b subunit